MTKHIAPVENAVIMTRKQFLEAKPAPGTIFVELGKKADILIASDIDVGTQEPDDVLMTSVGGAELSNEKDEQMYVVFKWGSWEGHEKQLAMHDEAARMMDLEAENNLKKHGQEYRHDDCTLGRNW